MVQFQPKLRLQISVSDIFLNKLCCYLSLDFMWDASLLMHILMYVLNTHVDSAFTEIFVFRSIPVYSEM